MDKVFKHVDQRRARFIAIVGEDEVASDTVTVRNVATKTKQTVSKAERRTHCRRLDNAMDKGL